MGWYYFYLHIILVRSIYIEKLNERGQFCDRPEGRIVIRGAREHNLKDRPGDPPGPPSPWSPASPVPASPPSPRHAVPRRPATLPGDSPRLPARGSSQGLRPARRDCHRGISPRRGCGASGRAWATRFGDFCNSRTSAHPQASHGQTARFASS